jgi:hypothetical protein
MLLHINEFYYIDRYMPVRCYRINILTYKNNNYYSIFLLALLKVDVYIP